MSTRKYGVQNYVDVLENIGVKTEEGENLQNLLLHAHDNLESVDGIERFAQWIKVLPVSGSSMTEILARMLVALANAAADRVKAFAECAEYTVELREFASECQKKKTFAGALFHLRSIFDKMSHRQYAFDERTYSNGKFVSVKRGFFTSGMVDRRTTSGVLTDVRRRVLIKEIKENIKVDPRLIMSRTYTSAKEIIGVGKNRKERRDLHFRGADRKPQTGSKNDKEKRGEDREKTTGKDKEDIYKISADLPVLDNSQIGLSSLKRKLTALARTKIKIYPRS